ncbi:MAG: hypothetical protein ACTSUE_05265 [Promethearchaeota archaeon]
MQNIQSGQTTKCYKLIIWVKIYFFRLLFGVRTQTTQATSNKPHVSEKKTMEHTEPSLWLEDFKDKENYLQELINKGSQRLTRLISYYLEVATPIMEEERKRTNNFREMQDKDNEAVRALYKEANAPLRKIREEGRCETENFNSDQIKYIQKKIDATKDRITERKRKFDLREDEEEQEEPKKHRKVEVKPSSSVVDEENFNLLHRISGYCDGLSEEAREKLEELKALAKKGELKEWEKTFPGRPDTLSLLLQLGERIDCSLMSFSRYLDVSNTAKFLKDENTIEGNYDVHCMSIYPLLLKMETIHPGNHIEDLKYIWYMVAEFYDFQAEDDAPKKEEFRGIGLFHAPMVDFIMHYPPPLENLDISPTTVVEALLMNQPVDIELVPYLSEYIDYDFSSGESTYEESTDEESTDEESTDEGSTDE